MAGGKRMRFRACVVIGDRKGKVATAVAKGADVPLAINKAVNKAQKSWINVPIINETIHKKGNLIIPSFSIERLQSLMYTLWVLYKKNKIPNIPIIIDSPMGNNVLNVFSNFKKWHKLSAVDYSAMCNRMNIIKSYKETWETIDNPCSKIIVAGSGMVTGGRVLTYLQHLINKESTTVLLVGYQAEGTRGRKLQEGAKEIKIYGKNYSVKARIKRVESLSAHADQLGIMDWLENITNITETVFLLHGERNALDSLKLKLIETHHWNAVTPKLHDVASVTI